MHDMSYNYRTDHVKNSMIDLGSCFFPLNRRAVPSAASYEVAAIKVEVHEKKNCSKNRKICERPKGFSILRIFSKFLPIFETLKNHISEKNQKYIWKKSVEQFLNEIYI